MNSYAFSFVLVMITAFVFIGVTFNEATQNKYYKFMNWLFVLVLIIGLFIDARAALIMIAFLAVVLLGLSYAHVKSDYPDMGFFWKVKRAIKNMARSFLKVAWEE